MTFSAHPVNPFSNLVPLGTRTRPRTLLATLLMSLSLSSMTAPQREKEKKAGMFPFSRNREHVRSYQWTSLSKCVDAVEASVIWVEKLRRCDRVVLTCAEAGVRRVAGIPLAQVRAVENPIITVILIRVSIAVPRHFSHGRVTPSLPCGDCQQGKSRRFHRRASAMQRFIRL